MERRGESSWRFTVDIGRDASGRRRVRRKTIRVNDPALLRTTRRLQDHLELELRKFQLEVESGNYVAPSRTFFDEVVDLWMERHVKRNLSPTTRQNYNASLRRWILPRLSNTRISDIKPMHINDLLEGMRAKGAGEPTIEATYLTLSSLFKYATKWHVISFNPITEVPKPSRGERRDLQVYDEKDLEKLFVALDKEPLELRCAILLAVTGGLRRGEVAGLEWHHIDLERKTLDITQSIPATANGEPVIRRPKTRAGIRSIAIPDLLVEQLASYREVWLRRRSRVRELWPGGGEFLFCVESGKPYEHQWLTQQWIALRRRHGLKEIRLHDLRHTAATWMIKAGIHPKAISARLGHTNISTTMDVYGHVIESVDHEAARAFDSMPAGRLKSRE